MDHQTIKEKLPAFRDPELSEEERREIAIHLPLCEECRVILKQWEVIGTLFAGVLPPASSESFVSGVMSRLTVLEEAKTPAVKRWPVPDWLLPILGYGFAFFLMFLAITHQESTASTESVLLTDVPQMSRWTYSAEPMDVDQLMDVSKEEV